MLTDIIYLHSTMFLLILKGIIFKDSYTVFTFHNVSINTREGVTGMAMLTLFTFHNVSINTTCFLLQHSTVFIYIPQCFY